MNQPLNSQQLSSQRRLGSILPGLKNLRTVFATPVEVKSLNLVVMDPRLRGDDTYLLGVRHD